MSAFDSLRPAMIATSLLAPPVTSAPVAPITKAHTVFAEPIPVSDVACQFNVTNNDSALRAAVVFDAPMLMHGVQFMRNDVLYTFKDRANFLVRNQHVIKLPNGYRGDGHTKDLKELVPLVPDLMRSCLMAFTPSLDT